MAEGKREVEKSGASLRRFTQPLTNVPDIPNFTLISPLEEICVHNGPKPPSSPPTLMRQTIFDFAIFYAKSIESDDDIRNFIEFVKDLLPGYDTPRIWASVFDIEGLGKSYLELVEYGIRNSNYYFLYIDQYFVQDKWANFQQEQCLNQYFKEPRVIVPVETIKNYTMPFSLRVFTSLKLWKIVDSIDDLSVKTFLDNPKYYWNVCDEDFLSKMRKMFWLIRERNLEPLSIFEEKVEEKKAENPEWPFSLFWEMSNITLTILAYILYELAGL